MQNIKITPTALSWAGSALFPIWAAPRSQAVFSKHGAFRAISVFLAAGWLFAYVAAAAATEVEKLEVEGFKLGMTVDEAKQAMPDLEVREVVRGGAHVGFEAQKGQAHVSFSSKELGSKVFQVQLIKIYRDKPDPYPIYMEYVRKYGRPDFGGRQMMSVQACWGRCFGSFKRMEFSMTVVGFGKKPFPMTLTLSDPELEKANHELFRKNLKEAGSK